MAIAEYFSLVSFIAQSRLVPRCANENLDPFLPHARTDDSVRYFSEICGIQGSCRIEILCSIG